MLHLSVTSLRPLRVRKIYEDYFCGMNFLLQNAVWHGTPYVTYHFAFIACSLFVDKLSAVAYDNAIRGIKIYNEK